MSASPPHAKAQIATPNLQNLLRERILALKKASELGRQHNALLPISTLPLELLVKIFRSEPSPHPGFGDPSWFMRNISQVCHHWRKAALGAPFLWSQMIDCQCLPPKWLRVVLRRARFSPLQVTVVPLDEMDGGRDFTDPNVHLALRELGNIGELNICCSIQEGIIRPMIKHFQRPAPSLKCLTLDVHESGDLDIGVQLLPASIFSGVTGPLQHLTLNNCLLDLDSTLYQRLTSLSITRIPEIIAPTTSRWLEMLRTAPNLTSLSLDSIFSPSPIIGRVQNVHLLRLSNFTIAGKFFQCSQFLSHLRYSALHTFELHLLDIDLENANIRNLPSLIKDQLSKVDPFRLCTVALTNGHITFLNGFGHHPKETEDTHFSISCVLVSSAQPADAPQLLSLLMNEIAPRMSHCEKLTLAFYPKDGVSFDESFKILFHAFSSATTLNMAGTQRMDEFFTYLATPDSERPANAADDDSTSPTRILLPNLQDLVLHMIHISPALIAFLEYRNKCHLAIKSIRFPDRFDDFPSLQAIKSLCSSIVVDGFVIAHAPIVVSKRLNKEYFDYEGEETMDLETDAVAGL